MSSNQGQQARVRILRRRDVEDRVGLSRSAIYALMNSGEFPRPAKLTPGPRGSVGWLESSIEAWIAERAALVAQ